MLCLKLTLVSITCHVRYLCSTNALQRCSSMRVPRLKYTHHMFAFPLQVSIPLVLASRRLTRFELVQVPSTDSQTTLVLIHTFAEALDVVCARTGLCHLGGCGVGGLVLGRELGVLGRSFGGGRGTASEPAADCVADGGTYCDTAIVHVSLEDACG
jgi:hypothetical protein